jgi:toxin-antitoxin system PIN domain toxin
MLADVNFWLALVLSKHVHHARVRAWFEAVPGPGGVGFCRVTQLSLLRLLTTEAVLAPYGIRARTLTEAWTVFEGLAADERVVLLPEPPELGAEWRRLMTGRRSSPKLWMDAYLAAFALSAGRRMVTLDAAFRQFAGLELVPLPE